MLGWDGDNIGSVLSPHKRKFMERIELRKKEGISLLMRYTIKQKTVVNVTKEEVMTMCTSYIFRGFR